MIRAVSLSMVLAVLALLSASAPCCLAAPREGEKLIETDVTNIVAEAVRICRMVPRTDPRAALESPGYLRAQTIQARDQRS